MIAYRVTAAARARVWQDAFSGRGSFLYGGRWSSPGTRMVYASTHLSLAALEIVVHANERSFLETRTAIRFEVPDELVMTLDEGALPEAWNAIPAPASSQQSGDAWARSGQSLALLVPTAVLPSGTTLEERNLLLNPAYPGFLSLVRGVRNIPFELDRRIHDLIA